MPLLNQGSLTVTADRQGTALLARRAASVVQER